MLCLPGPPGWQPHPLELMKWCWGDSFLYLKENTLTSDSSTSTFPACGIPVVWQPSFISSGFFPFQSKLAAFLLKWLTGSTTHTPNLFSRGLSSYTLGVLSRAHFLIVCNTDRLRIFQISKFWSLFAQQFPSQLSPSSHILLYAKRRNQTTPSALCLEISSKYQSSSLTILLSTGQ